LPTLSEIANAAGVSVTVASRVLSPKPELNKRVAAKTRVKVQAVAEQMGYVPNRSAEFLKRGKNPVIGIFLPRYDDSLVARLTFGISDEAARREFSLSFHYDMTYDSYRSFLDNARNIRNCGIITFPYFDTDQKCEDLIEEYVKSGGKIVMISQSRYLPNVPTVAIDDYLGGQLAGERFAQLKCDKVFCYISIGNRGNGCADFLKKHGIDCEVYAVEKVSSSTIYEKIKNSISCGCKTGFFAGTDYQAAGFYKFSTVNKWEIGKDVFVIGYDNQNYSNFLTPSLTSIDQPFMQVGCDAVNMLIDQIYNKEVESRMIKPTLIARESA
jgi:DNA-binding LacI/PurR family transcriptional regulator